MRKSQSIIVLGIVVLGIILTARSSVHAATNLRAGAYKIDISPRQLPAIMSGGFLEKTSDRIDDPLYARCLVLAQGEQTIAISIVDSCMLPRDICDEIKEIVARKAGIATNRILIAATHTHSAPSVMDFCLGSGKDEPYAAYLVPRVAEGICVAHSRLEPARAGWTVVSAPDHTHCRRWLTQPNAYQTDPFGHTTVRAMMHPGYQNPNYLGPAGPVDTDLGVLSIQTADGEPLCLLANYSMHYFGGSAGFSADYFGDFTRQIENHFAGQSADPSSDSFVAMMSQGTSGDLHWMDYSQPKRIGYRRQDYAAELAQKAIDALANVEYKSEAELAMAQTKITLRRRLPSAERLAWAKELNDRRGERRPKNRPEVYAQQAAWIDQHRTAELILQAIRIGDLAIATLPNEVYGVTGLRLKAQSPIPLMNFELANGAEGYIPPKEQHYLGGYTTWPARTAGLEIDAESRIVKSLLGLLEQVAGGQKRKPLVKELYNEQQRQALNRAREDGNNEENH